MNERSILTAHIRALIWELRQAQKNLELPSEERLRSRMQDRFGVLIKEHLRKLESLQNRCRNGQALDACWNSFANKRDECQPTLSECLALTQGALAREAGLDAELCEIADFLLDGLSARALSSLNVDWGRFTILAEQEFFGNIAAVIRLRYPGVNIWDL